MATVIDTDRALELPFDTSRFEIGYWLSSEEHDPRALVSHAVAAEEAGFGTAMISDHFHPWVCRQGQSPFVWAVIGGIATATERLRLGTGVTAPIIRMHPAVVAHAAATAAVMLEGRFFLGLGTGERLNEHVTGERWPGASERRDMLEEAVGVIRRLLDGGNVNHRGRYYRVENAELFTRSVTAPPIVLAASGPKGAALAAQVGDGMLGVTPDAGLVKAFEAAGGKGAPRLGQLKVCWAESAEAARQTVQRCWPNAALSGTALSDLSRPKDFEEILDLIPPEAALGGIVCGPDATAHVEALTRFAAAGFTSVHVHQIGPDQAGFLRFYQQEILPHIAAGLACTGLEGQPVTRPPET